jgi:hypothetical protein
MTAATTAVTRVPNFIGGRWLESNTAEWLDVISPATGDLE